MTTVSKTISSNKQYQLIDLNGELINFKIDYIIESTDNKPFEVSIVSQEHLDDNRPINYNNSENGKIIGTLENINNIRENYYIVLKSNEEVEVNIIINRNKLSAPTTDVDFELKSKENSFVYKYGYVIFIVIILIGFGVYYYKYIYNQNTSVSTSVISMTNIDNKVSTPQPNIDNKVSTPPNINTESYTPTSSIHTFRSSSEASSPASERSDISNGCRQAINELMSRCIDL